MKLQPQFPSNNFTQDGSYQRAQWSSSSNVRSGERALVVVKEGTGANTAQTPDTETKIEGMKIDNEFSDLSNDYTIQEKGNNYTSVKGKLEKNLIFWRETLSAISAVLEITDNGYKIPFFKTPECASFCNNQSALKNKDFVEETISKLVKCGSIVEAEKPPEVINPLSVSIKRSYLRFKIRKYRDKMSTKTK